MNLEIENIIDSIKQACIQISEKVESNNPLAMSDIVSTNESNDDVKNLDKESDLDNLNPDTDLPKNKDLHIEEIPFLQ